MAVTTECNNSTDATCTSNMVAYCGPDRASLQPQLTSVSNGTTLDYGALKHLKWSPRRQPERAIEVGRAIRDVVDRSKLRKVLQP
jgi:hypothetical protein